MIRRLRFAPGFVLLLSACGEARTTHTVAVRDSAGVRIVENQGMDALRPLGWRMSTEPEVEIGGADREPVLSQVTGACRLSDGSIVVASSGTDRVEVFAADGRHARSLGRSGDGPGEFRSIFHLACLPGDTVAAWDPLLGRLSVLRSGGEYVRATSTVPSVGSSFPQLYGILSGGRFVVAAGSPGGVPAAGKATRDTAEWLVIGPSGEKAGSVGRFPGTAQIAHADATGMLIRPLPFGLSTVAAVHGDRLYVVTGERYEVRVYDAEGRPRSIVRGDRPRLPVTRSDIDGYRRALVTFGGDAQSRRRHDALLDDAPYPREMPALAGLGVDVDGNLWVQETERPGTDTQRWTVFSPDGVARGTLVSPSGMRITQIGSDWVLGIALDADEVERVRLHRLIRSPR